MEKKTFKESVKDFSAACKEKAKETFYGAKDFYNENKEFLLVLSPFMIGGVKWFITRKEKNDERDDKELYVWDASIGGWHCLRRPLRPSEKIELDRRKRDGESISEILASMRVVK